MCNVHVEIFAGFECFGPIVESNFFVSLTGSGRCLPIIQIYFY